MDNDQRKRFNEWFQGLDGEGAFSLRIERFLDDAEASQFGQLIKWLEAAFEQGYNAGYDVGYELGKERGQDQAEDFYNLRN